MFCFCLGIFELFDFFFSVFLPLLKLSCCNGWYFYDMKNLLTLYLGLSYLSEHMIHLKSCDVLQCLSYLFFACFRNEKNQLLLGIRRANRPQTVMPSSVLSSDSMHLGLLAAAAHAAATNSRFTIFYNPRYESLQTDDIKSFGFIASLNIYSTFHVGLAHQSSLFP